MKNLIPLITLLIAFFTCIRIIPVVIRIAREKNLVDEPNHRTSHKRAVPTLGGIGIYLSFAITTLFFASYYYIPEYNYLLLGMMILFFLGIKDDILELSAKKKLAGQIIAVLLLTIGGDLRLTSLQGVFGVYEINSFLSIAISAFIFIALINAINLIDGIDGLASGVGILSLTFFGGCFFLMGHYGWAMLCLAMVGALSAFFLYNVFGNTNKIFMGDTGSLVLGIFLTAAAFKYIELNSILASPFTISYAPAVVIAVLILPIFDTLRVFSIRIAQGKSPFTPDKNHIHHQLLFLGFNHKKSTAILLGTTIFFLGFCFLLKNLNINLLIFLIVTTALAFIGVLMTIKKQRSKKIEPLDIRKLNTKENALEKTQFLERVN